MTLPRRLTYTSKKAFLRRMQMSTSKLFVFVEGKDDRYFYGELCASAFSSVEMGFTLCIPEELPVKSNGKKALLEFFDYLRKKSLLDNESFNKRTVAVFFADKDVDDLLRKQKRSAHMIYTEHYDMESYLFSYGDLVGAIAATAFIDRKTISVGFKQCNVDWMQAAAESWKDWVTLCLFTRIHKIKCVVNYSVLSRIHSVDDPYHPYDVSKYSSELVDLQVRSGLSKTDFDTAFRRVSNKIDDLYRGGQFRKVFKGKWYAWFLANDLKRIASGIAHNPSGLEDKLLIALQLSLKFDSDWAAYFKLKLHQVVNLH